MHRACGRLSRGSALALSVVLPVVLGAVLGGAVPRAHADEDPGKAALASASAAKRAAQKLEGEERGTALRAVTTQYDAVSADEAFDRAVRSEAAFRSGEILRTLKEAEAADARFLRATELGAEVEEGRAFAARGLLERAHLRRRAGEVDAALTLYGEVRERFAVERRSAAHAMSWAGKVLLGADRLAEARPVLVGFGEAYPEYPKEAVRNADLVAVELMEAGDEAGARQIVAELRAQMAPVLEAGDKTAASVQTALDAMKVTEMFGGY
jgi:hypothetical protein